MMGKPDFLQFQTSEHVRSWLMLLFAIAVVQLFFWFVFHPVFIQPASASIEPYEVSNPQIARLESPDPQLLAHAKFEELAMDRLQFAHRGYGAFRVEVEIPEVPVAGIGLLENGPGDNILVLANGQSIFGEGRMELPDNSYDHLTRQRIRIPAAILKPGTNIIEIIHTQEIPVEYAPGLPLIAEYKSVEEAFGWRQFLMNEARMIASALGILIAGFALVALLRADAKRTLFWLFVVSLLWPLRNIFQLWPDIPLHGLTRPLYYSIVTLGLAAAWPMLVDAWTERSSQYFRLVVAAIFGLAAILILFLVFAAPDDRWFVRIEGVLDVCGLALFGLTVARLVWHFATCSEARHWEAAMLVLLASLMALFLLNTLLWDRHVGYLNLGQPLFLIAFALAFFSRKFRLFKSAGALNTHLSEQLEARTADLQLAHEREKDLVRRAAYSTERQRIMRDMHDGLGSNLMSMMLAARRGEAKPNAVAEGLQSVIDEMRLMIDSMDSVGETLPAALARFRERTQSRVEGAGFSFEWSSASTDQLPTLNARSVLQIFRIMQEAVTNALKHSAGKTVSVDVTGSNSGKLTIVVSDDGQGMTGIRPVGHGLDNMQSRARSIRAGLDVSSDTGGTRVTISLEPSNKSAGDE